MVSSSSSKRVLSSSNILTSISYEFVCDSTSSCLSDSSWWAILREAISLMRQEWGEEMSVKRDEDEGKETMERGRTSRARRPYR